MNYYEIDGTAADAATQIADVIAAHGNVPVVVHTGDGGCAVYGRASDAAKDVDDQCSHALEIYEHYVPDHTYGKHYQLKGGTLSFNRGYTLN